MTSSFIIKNRCPTLDRLMESVQSYKPNEEMDIPEARILMIGQVGAGKSSFYNTIGSIFKGRIYNKAASGSVMKSLTTMFRIYDIQQASSRYRMNFRLCDTRGLEQGEGFAGEELSYLLNGNIPDRYQFNPIAPFSEEVPGFIHNPKLHEKMHCVVFVIDGSSVDVMPEKTLEKIKEIQSRIYQKVDLNNGKTWLVSRTLLDISIGQVVLLTKIDKLCPHVSDDVSTVFHSSDMRDAVDKISQIMGFPRSSILPVKNYENEVMLDDNISILALQALLQILNFADDYISNLYDRMQSEQPQKYDSNTCEKMKHLNVKE
ncbi:hypothetical protein KUTeg_009170 [Tegillarca granosa]|uniref:Interferon-induced protein 44-like n=1 Tax=Tegillarca granosa TaxID=220873 RepID=A0ABQ9F7A0_TEGGR|nr:hypothetical protein KUTeg_009170 [Tegillarca granosa]